MEGRKSPILAFGIPDVGRRTYVNARQKCIRMTPTFAPERSAPTARSRYIPILDVVPRRELHHGMRRLHPTRPKELLDQLPHVVDRPTMPIYLAVPQPSILLLDQTVCPHRAISADDRYALHLNRMLSPRPHLLQAR